MKSNAPQKIIHIHAKCEAFEVYEQVPENKSVSRIIRIRNNFEWASRRIGVDAGKLTVKTAVINPELQFY